MSFIQAIEDKVIVEVLADVNKTEGGLIIPDSAAEAPQKYGRVLSMGNDVCKDQADEQPHSQAKDPAHRQTDDESP